MDPPALSSLAFSTICLFVRVSASCGDDVQHVTPLKLLEDKPSLTILKYPPLYQGLLIKLRGKNIGPQLKVRFL